MTDTTTRQFGRASEALPGKFVDNASVEQRMTGRGELINQPLDRAQLAREGSYYITTNPTPATGIAGITLATNFEAAEALCTIRNGNTAGDNAKRLYMDYIKIQCTAAGTNGTNVLYSMQRDSGNTRWASGGTEYTPVNLNPASDLVSLAGVHFGALVTDAATSDVIKLSDGNLRTSIIVATDEFLFDFTGDKSAGSSALSEGSLVATEVIWCPPCVLAPAEELKLDINAASQSGASSFTFEIGFYLR